MRNHVLPAIGILAVPLSVSIYVARGSEHLDAYFRSETSQLADRSLAGIQTQAEWTTRRGKYREQLFEMLGLWPLPARTALQPVVTGKVEQEKITVEKLHFQSLPGLYVTANLYRPRELQKPAPAVLYVCGHGPAIRNGVSYGNKVSYQHHGAWFAQHGYVCLIIDTLQLGEIQGLHHGTHREGMWWWNSRGYTPAGVEAWNSIRALDYLETRPEVDPSRVGVTGRSGGGAYSWWLAALDDRIRAAAPVAGITDLQNHVVDGTVEGHCDCMFMVNTYRWDYPQVAALVAPRPLLIGNTDRDSIFPLDGVVRLHQQVRKVYELYGARTNLGLLITEGPHRDTQDLQVPVFRWFNRFLKGEDPPIEVAARKLFEPEQLQVFAVLPEDQKNTTIQASFVPVALCPPPPDSMAAWSRQRDGWMTLLEEKVFHGWPKNAEALQVREHCDMERAGIRLRAFNFTSQPHVPLRVYVLQSKRSKKPTRVVLNLLDADGWSEWIAGIASTFADELAAERQALATNGDRMQVSAVPGGNSTFLSAIQARLRAGDCAMAFFAPRGIGLDEWSRDEKKMVQIRRRFMLLGQTLEGMRVWDVRRAIQVVRHVRGVPGVPLWIEARGDLAVNGLYASLFESPVAGLELTNLPDDHQSGADYLNVMRILDLPQTVAMAVERSQVRLMTDREEAWAYPRAVASNLGWGGRLSIRAP